MRNQYLRAFLLIFFLVMLVSSSRSDLKTPEDIAHLARIVAILDEFDSPADNRAPYRQNVTARICAAVNEGALMRLVLSHPPGLSLYYYLDADGNQLRPKNTRVWRFGRLARHWLTQLLWIEIGPGHCDATLTTTGLEF